MKKLLVVLMLFIGVSNIIASNENQEKKDSTVLVLSDSVKTEPVILTLYNLPVRIDSLPSKVVDVYKSDTLIYKLINAMIYVESKGNDTISDRGGSCIGCLQIKKVLVRDVNRILKFWKINKYYKYSDRLNRERSIEMFLIINTYYHKKASWSKIAKSWNQGIGGMYTYKQKAQNYWNSVNKQIK